jgi:hypothetical protein
MPERRTSRSIPEFMTDCKRYHLDFLYDLASSSRRTAFRLDRILTHDKMENLTKLRPLFMMGAIVLGVRSIVPRKSIIRSSISRTRGLSRSSRKTKGRGCIVARRSRPAARWSLGRQGLICTTWSCVADRATIGLDRSSILDNLENLTAQFIASMLRGSVLFDRKDEIAALPSRVLSSWDGAYLLDGAMVRLSSREKIVASVRRELSMTSLDMMQYSRGSLPM